MGAGILDAAALLAAPLPAATTARAVEPEETLQDLPLWSSLYSAAAAGRAVEDYRRLFRVPDNAPLEPAAVFEREVLHYYATDADVGDAIDAIALGNTGDDDFAAAREALLASDLSNRLRATLR
jgi:hypothetical protein